MTEYTIKARAYREDGYGEPVEGERETSVTHTVGRYSNERQALRALSTLTDPTYNGWANRETWSAHLWLSNDEWSYAAATEAVMAHSHEPMTRTITADPRTDALRELLEDMVLGDEPKASLATDFLMQSLDRIDLAELVAAFSEVES